MISDKNSLDDSFSRDVDNTSTHMNKIDFNQQVKKKIFWNDCDYKCLNMKEDQSVNQESVSHINNNSEQEIQVAVLDNTFNQNDQSPTQKYSFSNVSQNLVYQSKKESLFYEEPISLKRKSISEDQKSESKIEQPNNETNLPQSDSQISADRKQLESPSINQQTIFNKVEQNTERIKEIQSQAPEEKIPVRLMKSINLLVIVKGFYRQLTKNSRIFEKLTLKQNNLIDDKTAFYKKQYGVGLRSFLNHRLLRGIFQLCYKINEAIDWLFRQIKLFQPNHSAKRSWDALQALLILYFTFVISLVIFFSLKIHDYSKIFSAGLIMFLIDMLFTFNTAIIEKGNAIKQRNKIAVKYFQGNFIFDVFGLVPFFLIYFNLTYISSIYSKIGFGFIIFKFFLLMDILESLSFFFSFQKNKKNLVDLFKVIFLIISVCHVFSILWHGLALYEIKVLQRDDTWINNQNLVDADVYIRYIYSFYYLAVTMQTVGYGDITPKNPIEIMFTVITMFCTGMIWAFSLNSIGNIIENINKVNKDYKDDMELIHCFMRDEAVESDLRVKVSNYLEYLHKVIFIFLNLLLVFSFQQNKLLESVIHLTKLQLIYQLNNFILSKESNETKKRKEKEIIFKLSKQLQQDLACEVQGKFLKGIPLIRDFISQKSQLSLIPCMEEILFSPGEIIFKQQEVDDSAIYYIVKGSVQIFFSNYCNGKKEHLFSELIKKQYFGEISFLTGQVRGASARASDFCRLFKIKREDFIQVIKQIPNDYENFQMVKEAVTLKNNLKFASIRCYLCNGGDHLSLKCPKTQLTLTKQIVLQKYNFSEPIKDRQNYSRRLANTDHKTLKQLNFIQEVIFNLINNPEYEYHLIKLENEFIKQDDDDMDEYSEFSSSESNSQSDSQSTMSQQTKYSIQQNEDTHQNKVTKLQSPARKSSIFVGSQQMQNHRSSQVEQKPISIKEKVPSYINIGINKQNDNDEDDHPKQDSHKKSISCSHINNNDPTSATSGTFLEVYQKKLSMRRSSQVSTKHEEYRPPSQTQLNKKNSLLEEPYLSELKKSDSLINEKNSVRQSLLNKGIDKRNGSISNQKERKTKDQQNKHKNLMRVKEKKSLAFAQIQNVITFQQNNNIAPPNFNDLQPQSNHQALGNFISIGSATGLNKLYTSQNTQYDQKVHHLMSMDEMNKRFDRLKNFKIYYPHNNVTEVVRQYDIIAEKNINALKARQQAKQSIINVNTNKKINKKGLQTRMFTKDFSLKQLGTPTKGKIKTPELEHIRDNSRNHTSILFGKRQQGQSIKELETIKED